MKAYIRTITRRYMRFSTACVPMGDLVEDLTQNLLQAYKSLYKFRGECGFYLACGNWQAYLFQISEKSGCIWMRRIWICGAELSEGDVSPEEHVSQKDIEKAVRKVVDDIPKKYRDVVVLRVYAELPFSQIAQILRISENSAKGDLFQSEENADGGVEG